MAYEVAVRLAVTAWLAWVSWEDIRRRRLSHWATTVLVVAVGLVALGMGIIGLVVGAAWPFSLLRGNALDDLALGLALIAVVLSDSPAALIPAAGGVGLAFWRGTVAGQTATVAWLLALALAKAGIIGAGDAKVGMVLTALFPDPLMGWCLLGACGLAGAVVLARRMGWAAPFLVREVVRDGLAGNFPARTGEKGVAVIPLTPVLAAGAVVYLWPLWLLGVTG